MRPIYISFYTDMYRLHAMNLIDSLDRFSLDRDVIELPSRESWRLNCLRKPEYILQKLEQHERAVVWIDADGVVRNDPHLFESLLSNGVHHAAHMSFRWRPRCKSEYLSGTMMFSSNDKTIRFLNGVIGMIRNDPHKYGGDQEYFRDGNRWMHETDPDWVSRDLPRSYCHIFDSELSGEEPVIDHHQASRRLKSKVGRHLRPFKLGDTGLERGDRKRRCDFRATIHEYREGLSDED